jgi:disulfide bond formation protein DsbB
MFKMKKMIPFWQQYGPYLALAPALTALLGSLYYSEIAGFIPCTLCWYQRILMYPLSLIILVGLIKQDKYLPNYVLPFSIIGMGVSTYHYLIELGLLEQSATCSLGIPCNVRWVNYFGFITIPLLALTAFAMITGIMAATKWAGSRSGGRFGLKQFGLLLGVIALSVLLISALAISEQSGRPPAEQFVPTPMGPGLGN